MYVLYAFVIAISELLKRHWRAELVTSGSKTSETGGQIFAEIFERPFLGVSQKLSAFPQRMFIYLQKFLMTYF